MLDNFNNKEDDTNNYKKNKINFIIGIILIVVIVTIFLLILISSQLNNKSALNGIYSPPAVNREEKNQNEEKSGQEIDNPLADYVNNENGKDDAIDISDSDGGLEKFLEEENQGNAVNDAGEEGSLEDFLGEEGEDKGDAADTADIESLPDFLTKRAYLGVKYITVDEEIQKENNLKVSYGALVTIKGDRKGKLSVVPDSAADKAGIVEGDIILEVNEVKINATNSLSEVISKHNPGDTVKLKIWHNGEEKNMEVMLEAYKSPF